MRTKRLITAAIATVLLIGGAAAVGAASPADQAAENATDAYEENSPDETAEDDEANGRETHDERAGGPDERAGKTGGVGPSDGLPEHVPNHVSEIHETIGSFLTGSTDNLGESLNSLLSGGEVTDETPNKDGDTSENSGEDASQSI
ncbi:MAG: hypothetical protein V5A36_02135 [Natronomonas sp.]